MKYLGSITLLLLLFSATVTAAPAWEYYDNTDPITDADRSIIGIDSNDHESALALQCQADGLNVMIITEHTFPSDGGVVVWRFDKQPPEGPSIWIPSYSEQTLFVPMSDVPEFVDQLKRRNQVIVRAFDHRGMPVTFTYNLMGFTRQYEKLSCKLNTL